MLFTDVEGSTRLLDRLGGNRYAGALELHRRVLREACVRHAVAAAAAAQGELERVAWPEDLPFRVRMGIHSGDVMAVPSNYVGLEVHRAASRLPAKLAFGS
jgi:class 3 adenylate cyclase